MREAGEAIEIERLLVRELREERRILEKSISSKEEVSDLKEELSRERDKVRHIDGVLTVSSWPKYDEESSCKDARSCY